MPGGRATAIFQRLIDGPEDVISLRHAMEGAVPELGTELAALLAEDLPALMADTGYHPHGLPALRAAVAAHFTSAGSPTTPEQVLVTTGVSQALALVAQMYLRRRSVVVVESPGWPGCFDVFRAAARRSRACRSTRTASARTGWRGRSPSTAPTCCTSCRRCTTRPAR